MSMRLPTRSRLEIHQRLRTRSLMVQMRTSTLRPRLARPRKPAILLEISLILAPNLQGLPSSVMLPLPSWELEVSCSSPARKALPKGAKHRHTTKRSKKRQHNRVGLSKRRIAIEQRTPRRKKWRRWNKLMITWSTKSHHLRSKNVFWLLRMLVEPVRQCLHVLHF